MNYLPAALALILLLFLTACGMSNDEIIAEIKHQLQNYTGKRCPFFCSYCGDKK